MFFFYDAHSNLFGINNIDLQYNTNILTVFLENT